MRYALPVALAFGLVLVGCEKKPKPETTTVEGPAVTPVDKIEPILPPEPKPATTKPAPAVKEPTPPVKPETPEPRTHVVKRKDTLWSIAERLLGDGKRWKEIQAINGGIDPRKLKVGQTLKIPPK